MNTLILVKTLHLQVADLCPSIMTAFHTEIEVNPRRIIEFSRTNFNKFREVNLIL